MVQLDLGGVLAQFLYGSFEMDSLLGEFDSAFGDLREQVGCSYRTEELAAFAGLDCESNRHIRKNLCESLRVFELLGFADFARLDECFDLLFVSLVYRYRNLLGEKEVAGISRLDGDLFAFTAEVFEGLYY